MISIRRFPIALLVFGLPVFAAAVPGINNFDKINEQVYRGAQPSNEGFRYLAQIGVKNIIDLREADGRSREEQKMVTAAGMTYINVPMTGLTPPTDAEINRILAILEDVTSGPVFVHCKRGADRTGAVIGAYHIQHDKWDNKQALKDAMNHGMSHFQFFRQSYIRNFKPRAIEAAAKPATTDAVTALPAVAIPAKN